MAEFGTGARSEWRHYYMLPFVAGLGYATSLIHIYGLGPYIMPISSEFGWSRTQTTIGLTIATIVQALTSIPIGMAVDRFGPRLLGVAGIVTTAIAFAALGMATGSAGNWYMLWTIMAIATITIQPSVWTAAVVSRFARSRGLALAITLCGGSVATSVFPFVAALLIDAFGWRVAFMLEAGLWFLLAFPLVYLFFRGATDSAVWPARKPTPAIAETAPVTLKDGLRSSIYQRLFLVSFCFTFTIVAIVVHFVPLLTLFGASAATAALFASLIGIASVAGRLITGYLLDRMSGSLIGAIVFLLPVAGTAILLMIGGVGPLIPLAAILIGLALGAEADVIAFLTTRYFGLHSFGTLYGGLFAALSIGSAVGPLIASYSYDTQGGYAPFLWGAIGLMLASSAALASLPRPHLALTEG